VSVGEFCEKFNGLNRLLAGGSSTSVKEVKARAAEMGASGTPSEMGDDARKGFAVVIGVFQRLDPNATAEDLQSVGSDVSAEDNRSVKAYGAWTHQNCQQSG
jgi:hypothetical protein